MPEENNTQENIKDSLAHGLNNIEPSAELTAEVEAEQAAVAEIKEEAKVAAEVEKETPPDPIDFEESLKSGVATNTTDKAHELRRNITLQDRVDKAYAQPGSLPSPMPGGDSVITRDVGGSTDMYGFVAVFTVIGLAYGYIGFFYQSAISYIQESIRKAAESSSYYGQSTSSVPAEYYGYAAFSIIAAMAAFTTAFFLIFKMKAARITAIVTASAAVVFAMISAFQAASDSSSSLYSSYGSLSSLLSLGWFGVLVTAVIGAIIVLSLFRTDRL